MSSPIMQIHTEHLKLNPRILLYLTTDSAGVCEIIKIYILLLRLENRATEIVNVSQNRSTAVPGKYQQKQRHNDLQRTF